MVARQKQQNIPAPQALPPELQAFLAAIEKVSDRLTAIEQKLAEKPVDTTEIPDHVKADLDVDDARLQGRMDSQMRNARQEMERHMVEITPARTTNICIEGNVYTVIEGQTCTVPQAVADVLRQSDEQYRRAQREYEMLRSQTLPTFIKE